MKDLTAFGANARRQQKRTDSDQLLKDKTKSSEFTNGMKSYQEVPGYGDPEPESEENQSFNT